ncbi:MAG: 16S rRNA (uracil(1498)-N(3))-methyltransferase [Pseudomonadota bacterium]
MASLLSDTESAIQATMARYAFRMQRLFVDHPLVEGERCALDKQQSNYLINVLRMRAGDDVLLFNGRDGEWRATIADDAKKAAALSVAEQTRAQTEAADIDYLFAPLKHARLDYMVQKAVEMGASRLRPVITAHTQTTRLNLDRMRANVIEACEQCGILNVPSVLEPVKLASVLSDWRDGDDARKLIFCDEGDEGDDPVSILRAMEPSRLAILIGPEGGFSEDERKDLKARDFVTAIPLGPRILRADTAAVAALAIVQASVGDWVSRRKK